MGIPSLVLTQYLYAIATGPGARGEQGPGSVFMEIEFGDVGAMGACEGVKGQRGELCRK